MEDCLQPQYFILFFSFMPEILLNRQRDYFSYIIPVHELTTWLINTRNKHFYHSAMLSNIQQQYWKHNWYTPAWLSRELAVCFEDCKRTTPLLLPSSFCQVKKIKWGTLDCPTVWTWDLKRLLFINAPRLDYTLSEKLKMTWKKIK